MPDVVTNELLYSVLQSVQAKIGRVDERIGDLTLRMGHVEEGVARLHVDVGQVHVILAEQSGRFDRMDARLARIEKRWDLADA